MFNFFKDKFQKIKNALSKTHAAISGRLRSLFSKPLDESTFETLEQILYEADMGTSATLELVEQTRVFLKKQKEASIEEILEFLHAKALEILLASSQNGTSFKEKTSPQVILVVGVNGSGKTTSIAKLAYRFKEDKQTVLLAAGDTFRAAAIDQLTLWAEKIKVPLIKSLPGQDPSSVAFDAVSAAKARGIDRVIIDTAGRLQNKTDLMRELEKLRKVIQKVIPDAPHETLLVLDATTGQNALDQAEVFNHFTPLTGIILAKLDGSAKGGIVLSIAKKLKLPVQWVGVGEQIDDLIPFDPLSYCNALFKPN